MSVFMEKKGIKEGLPLSKKIFANATAPLV